MNKEKLLKSGLIEMYVLGLTSEEETQAVLRGAASYPEVKQEITLLRSAMEAYAVSQAVHPPQGLKEQILSRLDEDIKTDDTAPASQKKSRRFGMKGRTILLWSTLFLLVATSLSQYKQSNLLLAENKEISEELIRVEEELNNCQAKSTFPQDYYTFLADPNTRTVVLRGTDASPGSVAILCDNPIQKRAFIHLLNVPSPDSGKQFQVWAEVNGEMKNMGVIPNQHGSLHSCHFVHQAERFNVTLEPYGGSTHPSTRSIFLTQLRH